MKIPVQGRSRTRMRFSHLTLFTPGPAEGGRVQRETVLGWERLAVHFPAMSPQTAFPTLPTFQGLP